MALRFHLDEHMAAGIASALRQHGVEVSTTPDAGLLGASDEDQLAFARSSGAVLVTQDADFLRIHRLHPEHAGIAFCRPASRSLGYLVRRLLMLHRLCHASEMAGRVEYL